MKKMKPTFTFLLIALFVVFNTNFVAAQVKLLDQVKIADEALHLNGKKIPQDKWLTHQSTNDSYDRAFGDKISVYRDCMEAYGDYVFLAWYKGGMTRRNVMLSRYNLKTKKLVTIQFPHRHTGFQNNPGIGEAHNTISVGISPIDGTVHLLYDMHAYSPTRPSNRSLKNDYFRYQYSVKNAATLPDNQFTLDKFYPKQLFLKKGENYEGLTYPNFFTNKKNELFMWIRRGGHNNGQYLFAKYDGNSWSNFRKFNELSARSQGGPYNWGLYGDIKFEQGKMRIGFHTRIANNKDVYENNNGFYYAYTDDPEGINNWYTHDGSRVSMPVKDPRPLKISEPGDQVQSGGRNSVRIGSAADWTVTERGDIHFKAKVSGTNGSKNVHTYKKAGSRNFTTSTNFPGGDLHAIDNDVYLVGLDGNGRPFIERAQGGTNNWKNIYKTSTGRRFRHGVVQIKDGILYYFLMERSTGSGQPIYLQTFDLDLDTVEPPVQGQQPYKGVIQIPGTFEAENYDNGGNGVAYLDNSPGNSGNVYRNNERVDVGRISGGGYHLGWTNDGEWIEYTINVAKAARYNFNFKYSSIYDSGIIGAELPDLKKVLFRNGTLKSTGNWNNYKNRIRYQVDLPKGRHVLRLNVIKGRFNIDKITVEESFNQNKNPDEVNDLDVYPNPTQDGMLFISEAVLWRVYSITGKLISKGEGTQIDLSSQTTGVYLLKTENGIVKKIVLN